LAEGCPPAEVSGRSPMRCSFVQSESGSHKQHKSKCTQVRFRHNGSPTNKRPAFKSTSQTIHEHSHKNGERHLRHPRHAGLSSPPLQRRLPAASKVLTNRAGLLFLRPERQRTLPFFAPLNETHKAPRTKDPGPGLQPLLHTLLGPPLGSHTEPWEPPAAADNGPSPWPSGQKRAGGGDNEDPLGKTSEQKRPPPPHIRAPVLSKRACITFMILPLAAPPGPAPRRLSNLPATIWAIGWCSWTWADPPLLGSDPAVPFQPALPGSPPCAEWP
jgi:hypothetical protein